MVIGSIHRYINERRLQAEYTQENFLSFMKSETYCYSQDYVKNRVKIHGKENILDLLSERGAVFAPLHYGSFFLIGGALASHMNLKSTAIVTYANLTILSKEDADFWIRVHRRTEKIQGEKLFYAGLNKRSEIVDYLGKPNSVLWAMIDVREFGRNPKEYPFTFQDNVVYFQVGAAKLAILANAPFIPTCIKYNPENKFHDLYIGKPIAPTDSPLAMTQLALDQIGEIIKEDHVQFFHDLNFFSKEKLNDR